MKYAAFTHPDLLAHAAPYEHPENPARLEAILSLFVPGEPLADYPRVTARTATEAELLRAHGKDMVRALLASGGRNGQWDADTYYGPQSLHAALLAAGGTIDLALRVWKGELRRGFSLVRPPGHHATPQRAMGFCLFNNIALAAQSILAENPQARLAIVDFDLHHGNGTQDRFIDNPNVLFLSSHRFPFYPGTGSLGEVGEGRGKGTTLNFPLAQAVGREIFFPLYGGLVASVLKDFRPDMILVSAGFDGHESDPMNGFALTTEDYGRLAEFLIAAAEETTGKILFVLEGGYDPKALRDSVKQVLDVIATHPQQKRDTRLDSQPILDPFIHQAKKFYAL